MVPIQAVDYGRAELADAIYTLLREADDYLGHRDKHWLAGVADALADWIDARAREAAP